MSDTPLTNRLLELGAQLAYRSMDEVTTGEEELAALVAEQVSAAVAEYKLDAEARLLTAITLLEEARDDVEEVLNIELPHAGYPKNDQRIAAQQGLLSRIDAAIASSAQGDSHD